MDVGQLLLVHRVGGEELGAVAMVVEGRLVREDEVRMLSDSGAKHSHCR